MLGMFAARVGTGHAQPDPQQWWENPLVWIIVACVIVAIIGVVVAVYYVNKRKNTEFTVSLNNDGEVSHIVVKRGERVQLPLIRKDGYRFGGWFIDTAMTIPFLPTHQVTYDMMLYAKWVKEAV